MNEVEKEHQRINGELREQIKKYEYNEFAFCKQIDDQEQTIKALEERIEKAIKKIKK